VRLPEEDIWKKWREDVDKYFKEMEKKWREDVNKVYSIHGSKSSHGSESPSPELEELMLADYLLERAYARDPLVMTWFDAHGYTTEDLEMEIKRLERALAGKRVGAPIIDILRMREDIAEKERHLTPLTGLELILEGAQRMQKWALDKMKEKGFATVEELEAEVDRLREIVLDPNQNQLMLKEEVIPKEEAFEFFKKHYQVSKRPMPPPLKSIVEKYEWKRVPELKYPIPILPELEYNRDNRLWLGAMLDAEGTVIKAHRGYDRVDELYRYEYLHPYISFAHTNEGIVEKFRRLTDEEYSIEERPPPLRTAYRFSIYGVKTMSTLYYTRPYLIVHVDVADNLFKQFKEWFSIKLK